MGKTKEDESLADECPKCGEISYQGGFCFGCGVYRPSKRTKTADLEALDGAGFMTRSFGTQMTALEETEDDWDEFLQEKRMQRMQRRYGRKKPAHKSVVYISEQNLSEA